MAGKNGSVIIGIDGDDSGFKGTLSGISKAAGKSIAAVAKMSTAVYAAGKAIGTLGVKYNAEIEQLQTSFEVMTGSAEKAVSVVNRLRTMGAETPFEMTDLANITQLLMQYGFTADDALEKMSMLGDISQGNAEAMRSIATGYAQMSSAGKVNLQDIKQMINGGFNPLQEISERTGESMASLYDRISKGTLQISEITESMKAATSEGGKFFQSMEKQSKTLNGQLSTLKDNANQLLGTLTEGMSEGLRTELLPLANNLIGELQKSFESGGVQGLIDSATSMIPDLLGMMTGKLEDAISGVSRWLPKGAAKIMEALPGALKSATTVIPKITTALFEVASTVVGNLVGMLPELIPSLVTGVRDMVVSVFTGLDSLVGSLFAGIEQAFHIGKTKIAGVWVADEEIAKYNFDVDIDTNEKDIEDKINGAKKAIEEVLAGIEGIDASAIANAIISGDVTGALEQALITAGVDPAKARKVADNINSSQRIISNAIKNLNVGEEASEKIREMAANGATGSEIAEYIESLGVDKQVAIDAGEKIASAGIVISDQINNLPPTVQSAVNGLSFSSERETLVAALQLLGLNPADIDEVIASYNATSNLLSRGVTSIFDNIKYKLTDGLPDTEEVMGELEDDVRQWAKDAYEKIDEWYESEIAALKESGKTGAEYESALLDIDQKAQGMRDSVQESEVGTIGFLNSMAGKATEYVRQHLGELEEIGNQALEVSKQIDLITEKTTSVGKNAYDVVRSGANANEQTIATAIKYKVTEFKLDSQSLQDAHDTAIEKLNEEFAAGKITKEEYNTKIEAENTSYQEAQEALKREFDNAFNAMITGIAKSEGKEAALQEALKLNGVKISLNDFLRNAYTEDGEINADFLSGVKKQLADVLGEQFSEVQFDSFITSGDALGLQGYINVLSVQVESLETEALQNALGGKIGAAWAAALESDELTGTSFDVSGTEAQLNALYQSMFNNIDLSPVGDDFGAGVGEGMANHDYSIEAEATVDNIESDLRSAAESHSPARRFVPVGKDIAAGVAQGIGEYDASGVASTLISGIVRAVRNESPNAQKAGESIATGAAIGIGAKKHVAIETAAAMARAVVAKIRSVFDSHSPSRVAIAIGNDFGDGMSIGLREGLTRAVNVAQRMSGEIATAASLPSMNFIRNMPDIASEITVANEQSATPVLLDGKQIAEIQGYNNSSTIAWRNTKAARGVGSR